MAYLGSIAPLTSGVGQAIGDLIALGGIAYLVLALRAVWQWREEHDVSPVIHPPVTIMVPVCGAPAGLHDCLRSVFRQDYANLQIVFGLHGPEDPGRIVIDALRQQFTDIDSALVIDETRIGSNPKICNLSNMMPAVKYDIIVMIDSDVKVDSHFITRATAPMNDRRVGAMTFLYKAEPVGGLVSQLGAMAINDWFIPSALVDLSRREMDLCYGAAIVLSRESLEAVGGLAVLANSLGEDDEIGERLHNAGYEVRLARQIVTTLVTETDPLEMWRRELRWIRSVRACRPRDHVLSVVMYALAPVAILVAVFPSVPGLVLLGSMLSLRIWLHLLLRRRTVMPTPVAPWLVPVRECLSFCLWLASFSSRRMHWRNSTFDATGGRDMAVCREHREKVKPG